MNGDFHSNKTFMGQPRVKVNEAIIFRPSGRVSPRKRLPYPIIYSLPDPRVSITQTGLLLLFIIIHKKSLLNLSIEHINKKMLLKSAFRPKSDF